METNYRFVAVDPKRMMKAIDDLIGTACNLNSQNYENLIQMRGQLEQDLQKIYKIEISIIDKK
jgi:hypothetical protein